jgi:hypothetical protein
MFFHTKMKLFSDKLFSKIEIGLSVNRKGAIKKLILPPKALYFNLF